MQLTYLGTAMIDLRVGDARFVTDPALDPRGTTYDFGMWCTPRSWFASEKQYDTPPLDAGAIDAVLLSHDQHADNLDFAGRKLLGEERIARCITTVAGAKRLSRPRVENDRPGKGLALGERIVSLAPAATTRIGRVVVRAIVARHGPRFVPQVHEVTGFVVDVDAGPRIWISGDTVMFPALAETLSAIGKERPVDVAVVHCGAVAFPKALGFGSARFTFDAADVVEACKLVQAKTIIPIHRSGWAHFRQAESELLPTLEAAGLAERTKLLALGESVTL
ncbi:MAG TPA: MBL fold metallo-hydrolase [Kofleriaceae bacterium]|jgi:L-ascorbate metabolism protein UlaG (beta-lactamase superfamily)